MMVTSNDERQSDGDTIETVVPDASGGTGGETVPAIAQEAFTDVVESPPGIRSRQRRIEEARARGIAARTQAAEVEAAQAEVVDPDPTPVDGIVPTAAQPPEEPGGSLSQRLDG